MIPRTQTPKETTATTAEEEIGVERKSTGAMVMTVIGPPQKNKNRHVLVNTRHCRAEIDTL